MNDNLVSLNFKCPIKNMKGTFRLIVQPVQPNPCKITKCAFNILWPSDAIWWLKFGSTLAQIIACCLTAPSYHLNQDWLSLTHWGRVTHTCIGNLTIIGSDNGLSPGWRQAIIWTEDRLLSIGPLWTNFSQILIVIHTFSFKKMRLKMWSGKWQPFCLGLNVLTRSCGIYTAEVNFIGIPWYVIWLWKLLIQDYATSLRGQWVSFY